jgi:hypothetical protein
MVRARVTIVVPEIAVLLASTDTRSSARPTGISTPGRRRRRPITVTTRPSSRRSAIACSTFQPMALLHSATRPRGRSRSALSRRASNAALGFSTA